MHPYITRQLANEHIRELHESAAADRRARTARTPRHSYLRRVTAWRPSVVRRLAETKQLATAPSPADPVAYPSDDVSPDRAIGARSAERVGAGWGTGGRHCE